MSLHGLDSMIHNPHRGVLGALLVAGIGLGLWISAKKVHPLLQWPIWTLLLTAMLFFSTDETGTNLDASPEHLSMLTAIGCVVGGLITLSDVRRRRTRASLAEKIVLEKRRYGRQPPMNLG